MSKFNSEKYTQIMGMVFFIFGVISFITAMIMSSNGIEISEFKKLAIGNSTDFSFLAALMFFAQNRIIKEIKQIKK